MSIARARLLEPLEESEVSILKSTLIIGAGIAGISTALDLGDAGFKVYLVEKKPTIGGHMAQWDKTFPTLDCSSCILTPRMAEVGAHPNIELITMAEVDKVDGFVGNFNYFTNTPLRTSAILFLSESIAFSTISTIGFWSIIRTSLTLCYFVSHAIHLPFII